MVLYAGYECEIEFSNIRLNIWNTFLFILFLNKGFVRLQINVTSTFSGTGVFS
jgi:hypothetical protein